MEEKKNKEPTTPEVKTPEVKKKEWYKHGWGLVLVILFFPYFLIWYAWAKSSWSKNIKIAVTFVVAIVMLPIMTAIVNTDVEQPANNKPNSETKTQQNAETKKEELVVIPKYEIVKTKYNVGIAKNEQYYVLINPVDLSNDAFKTQIKAIFTDLAKKAGKPEFGAHIYTDKEVLEYSYDPQLPYPDGFSATQEQIQANVAYVKSMGSKSETTLIAIYNGGVVFGEARASKEDEAYVILWFPSTFTTHPTVGKYIDSNEKWKAGS